MPEPVTFLLGGIAVALIAALVGFNRFTRLRRHIEETARAVAVQREQRDELIDHLRAARAGEAPPGDSPPGVPEGPPEEHLREQVTEAEDRLAAVNRLHSAQIRAWNRLGRMSPWRFLRGLTGWTALSEPPPEGERAALQSDERS